MGCVGAWSVVCEIKIFCYLLVDLFSGHGQVVFYEVRPDFCLGGHWDTVGVGVRQDVFDGTRRLVHTGECVRYLVNSTRRYSMKYCYSKYL